MVLLRRLLGDVLRERRQRQGRTLRDVSSAARVSLGYLSEVERGQKEASSELLASICTALDVPLSEVLREVSDQFSLAEALLGAPTGVEPAGAAPAHTLVLQKAPAGARGVARSGAGQVAEVREWGLRAPGEGSPEPFDGRLAVSAA